MVKKTYKELLEGLKYSDLGYTGERKPLTDPKYKQFSSTINQNKVIANTHIDSSLPPQMPQAQVSGQGTNPWAKTRRNAGLQDPKGAEVSTVGGTSPTTVPTTDTPLTIDAKYSDFTKWAQEHGVDSDKIFDEAMALARTQYEQSRATYGLQAEQLAQAGLTNSGVSDNLERAAYAQKVQAEQAALDQKAALDLANKQAYGSYKDQQRQQYTDLFQKFVFGYEDEYGNIHAPVSPDEAVSLLKLAGLTDDAMIADLRKSYDEYKGVADKKAQEQQQAIAGIDSTTGGFSADSMFGKLFAGTMTSEDFLDQIQKDYGVRFNTDEEAVDALLKEDVITKEQSSLFYREMINNSIDAIVDSKQSAKETIKSDDSDLYSAIKNASDAYKTGKMSKADWDAFRSSIMSENSPLHIGITPGSGYNFKATLKIGDSTYTKEFVVDIGKLVLDSEKSTMLDNAANGMNMVVYNDELYLKYNVSQGDMQNGEPSATWVRVPKVLGSKNTTLKQMLKLLAEG